MHPQTKQLKAISAPLHRGPSWVLGQISANPRYGGLRPNVITLKFAMLREQIASSLFLHFRQDPRWASGRMQRLSEMPVPATWPWWCTPPPQRCPSLSQRLTFTWIRDNLIPRRSDAVCMIIPPSVNILIRWWDGEKSRHCLTLNTVCWIRGMRWWISILGWITGGHTQKSTLCTQLTIQREIVWESVCNLVTLGRGHKVFLR